MISDNLIRDTRRLVLHQLGNYWLDIDDGPIAGAVPEALAQMEADYAAMPSPRFFKDGGMVFSPYFSVTWTLFLYRLSHLLARDGFGREADMVYYLNKIMHSVDWFHQIELPTHFMAEHPLGSVLGRAQYGDYLFVYQGTTVGGNRRDGKLYYPTLGSNVVLYSNAKVLGDSHIGSNVVLSANAYLINETVPDNCVVFGQSPNIVVKRRSESEMREMTSAFWKW